MIKYSVISSLYNAEKYVYGLFKSFQKQRKINKKEFEVILINDGSKDSTVKTIEKHKNLLSDYQGVKVIDSEENKGQGYQRLKGAKLAKGEYLIYVDAKTRPDNDYLFQYLTLAHEVVIGNVYMDKERSIWDRYNHILRVWLYKPYYGVDFEDVSLDAKQYKDFKLKGGGGALWVKREYFLQVNSNVKFHKYLSDDSMIIGQLSKITPVLKSSKPKIKYLCRKGLIPNIKHTFQRGPKFISYYFVKGSRYYPYIILLILGLLINGLFIIINPNLLLLELLVLLIVDIIFSIIISKTVKDFIASFLLTPVYFFVFCIGNIYGLYLKIFNKFDK
jgi:glycosyltransferase involved in cell wall biosynthesis